MFFFLNLQLKPCILREVINSQHYKVQYERDLLNVAFDCYSIIVYKWVLDDDKGNQNVKMKKTNMHN